MKIRLSFDVSMEERLAIASYYGERKPANRGDVESMIRSAVSASLSDYKERMKEDKQ